MANRICFLVDGHPADKSVLNKFIDSFRQCNLSSQADVAMVFDSDRDRDETFPNLKSDSSTNLNSEVKIVNDGAFFLFDAPKSNPSQINPLPNNYTSINQPQEEFDDDDGENFFFFMGDRPKKQKKSVPEISQSMVQSESLIFDLNSDPQVPKTQNDKENLIPIVMPKSLQSKFNGAGTFRARSIYGIEQLKNNYDYIVVLESGTTIVKNVDLHALFDQYFNQRTLWGNLTDNNVHAEWIKMSCTKWFADSLDWYKVISPLYLWLNQPFIYRTDTLDEFFKITGLLDNLTAIAWTDFPYYIYMYYLMLYRGFKIRDIGLKSNVGVCESSSIGNIREKSPEFKPMICKKSIQRHLDNDNLFLVFGA